MRIAALCWLSCLLLFACGGSDVVPGGVSVGNDKDGGSDDDPCVDADGDGFGSRCRAGADCDDDDPEITNECRICALPNEGCACTPGTKPTMCDPDDVRTTVNGVTGTIVCTEGYRYCRDGKYSDCEIIQMYARFIAD